MLGLGLGRFIPARIRPFILAWTKPALEAEALFATRRLRRFLRRRPHLAYRGIDVAIIGFFRSRIGIGRAAELLAEELHSAGAKVRRIDVTDLFGFDRNIEAGECRGLDALSEPGLTDIVIHMNPPQFYRALRWIDPRLVKERALIGYFAWELARVPRGWQAALACVDQVWVPSVFVRDAIGAGLPAATPRIRVSPHRLQPDIWRKPTLRERQSARGEFGLPDGVFVFLTSFAMTSSLARKNPLGAVHAFRKAFPKGDRQVALIIRCLDHEAYPKGRQRLLDEAGMDRRIRVVLEEKFGTSIRRYYHAADSLVSLHRGEGFGLNIAEALAMDIPVVATAWSLNDEFVSHPRFYGVPSTKVPITDPQRMYSNVSGTTWADPDLDEAARLLNMVRAGKPAR